MTAPNTWEAGEGLPYGISPEQQVRDWLLCFARGEEARPARADGVGRGQVRVVLEGQARPRRAPGEAAGAARDG